MARRRALIAGLGTTGVLIAFAALLLVVVGALMGFRGWPGDQGVPGSGAVSIDGRRLLSAEPPTFAGAGVPDAVRRALSGPRRRLSRRSGGRGDGSGAAGVRAGSGSEAAPGFDAGGGAGATGSGPAPAGGGSDSSDVSDSVADTVEQITYGTAGGVGETTAPAGQLVEDTGSAVSGTVRELGSGAEARLKLP